MGRQTDALGMYTEVYYTLVEGCTIGGATHYACTLSGYPGSHSNYNVLRNNTFQNYTGAVFEVMGGANNNLIEGNIMIGGRNSSHTNGTRSFKLVAEENIIRNNLIRNNTASDSYGFTSDVYVYDSFPNSSINNRVYNNTVTDISRYATGLTNYGGDVEVRYNVWKNNLIYANSESRQFADQGGPDNEYNSVINNLFYKSGVSDVIYMRGNPRTVVEQDAADPTYWSGNIQQDPNLDDDYRLLPGSPCIDAGTFLSTTTSTGSGTNIPVQDATYFMDGWGIIEGDLIQLESQSQTVRIVSISGNTITVNQSISWKEGDGVSLPYSGSAPDIGPFENALTNTPLSPPTNLVILR